MWLLFLCKIKYDIEQVVGIQCDPSKTTHGGDNTPGIGVLARSLVSEWVFSLRARRGPDGMGLRPRTLAVSLGPEQSRVRVRVSSRGEPLSMFCSDPHNSARVPLPPCWPPCCEKAPLGVGASLPPQHHSGAPIPSCLHFSSPSLPTPSPHILPGCAGIPPIPLGVWGSPTLAPNRCSVRIAPMHSCYSCEETNSTSSYSAIFYLEWNEAVFLFKDIIHIKTCTDTVN